MYNAVTYAYPYEQGDIYYYLFADILVLSFLGLIFFITKRINHIPPEEEETDEKAMGSLQKIDMFQC